MRDTGAAPILHVGGEPSATQRALIEQLVWLTVKCSLIDAKISAAPIMITTAILSRVVECAPAGAARSRERSRPASARPPLPMY
jgi:hypothetical protein